MRSYISPDRADELWCGGAWFQRGPLPRSPDFRPAAQGKKLKVQKRRGSRRGGAHGAPAGDLPHHVLFFGVSRAAGCHHRHYRHPDEWWMRQMRCAIFNLRSVALPLADPSR